MNFLLNEVFSAMESKNPALQLRTAIESRLSIGEDKELLRKELTLLRTKVPEAAEDVILEVLDFLDGWCAPSLRL